MPRLRINSIDIDRQPSLFDDLEMKDYKVPEVPVIRFISFGSGSSGNCSYIGNDKEGFLIDAGVAPDKVIPELKRRGILLSSVRGVLLTHDHGDHVRYVYKLLKKAPHMAVYATPKALGGLLRRHTISSRIRDYHRPIYIETPFKIGSFEITPFQTLHDGTDNVGFFIALGVLTMAIATDLGSITDRVDHYMRLAKHIVIESNYDVEMLRNGSYPQYLKARIVAPNGHLDNEVTASFLASIYTPMLSHIFLCHLSNENNEPQLALNTVSRALTSIGVTVGDASGSLETRDADVQLYALPRFEPSLFFTLK
ncbi:MAG: MBL fold metallo-hydrolase [Muribaculaceae bacterium]|nr:MBL fold metallo-hydrolase [Muribaculaceae bacterium]